MNLVKMLERNAALFPEKTAIVHGESRISFKQFCKEARTLAGFLKDCGLKKGDRVGLMLEKSPEAIISFLGIAGAGGIVCPIDYKQPVAHIQSITDLTGLSNLIISDNLLPLLDNLNLSLSADEVIVVGGLTGGSSRAWAEIMTREDPGSFNVEIQANDVVYLNFTSGTTGFPKGAITTHANIYWNTVASVESLGLTRDDIHLCMFPSFLHPHELFARPLYLGGTVVMLDDNLPISIASAVASHRVTCLMAIAFIYQTLVHFRPPASMDYSSLRIAESGGMPVSPALAEEFANHFGVPIIPVWGSTETAGIALAAPVHGKNKPGSIGKPCPHYEVSVVDDNGDTVATDEIGELVIRGPAVCSGYFDNTEETAKCMKDGWFITGDLVKRDAEGYYYFVGRKTGMIKIAGLKVFPGEIENILGLHPKVAEVAVVKILDRLNGEAAKAIIVLKEGKKMSKAEAREYCAKRLPRYKVPQVIEFLTELPRTPGGKILYRELVR